MIVIVIVIFFLGGLNAENRGFHPDEHTLLPPSPRFDDTCEYLSSSDNWQYICGDKCYDPHGQCDCGADIDIEVGLIYNPERCCIPSNESCSTTGGGYNAQCDEGIVLPMNSFCREMYTARARSGGLEEYSASPRPRCQRLHKLEELIGGELRNTQPAPAPDVGDVTRWRGGP